MPPGMTHRVYTPEKTICQGGRFWSWETMHLTAFSLQIDNIQAAVAGEEHHEIESSFSRMAMSLAKDTTKRAYLPYYATAPTASQAGI